MAKMCPMDGCVEQKGMCIHDKMMVAMVVIVVLMAIAYFGFGVLG